jgi:tetratricopeptide (TPR) repeat protein
MTGIFHQHSHQVTERVGHSRAAGGARRAIPFPPPRADPGSTRNHPDYPWALNNLAAALTNRGDVASAIPIAQRAAQVLPENPAIMDTLGWSLLKRGQAADAVAALGEVHAAAPSNPETLYRFGGGTAGGRRCRRGARKHQAGARCPPISETSRARKLRLPVCRQHLVHRRKRARPFDPVVTRGDRHLAAVTSTLTCIRRRAKRSLPW